MGNEKTNELNYSTNSANALIHLYRAEVGKMTAYRQRLDMTTNWAVVTTAGLSSFAFGNEDSTHVTFLFAMIMNYFFLHLEARRFRQFEIAHHRVRIMERFFYPAMLGDHVDASWHHVLLGELSKPVSPMRRKDALAWRLRRNYIWIYLGILVAWITKVDVLHQKSSTQFQKYIELFHVGSLPGGLIVGLVLIFYAIIVQLAVRANKEYPLEED